MFLGATPIEKPGVKVGVIGKDSLVNKMSIL